MKDLVQMSLGSGEMILVEVEGEGETGMQPAGAVADYVIGQLQHSFDAVLKTINSNATSWAVKWTTTTLTAQFLQRQS